MEREELIKICEDAVVPYTKWGDRDSYSAQCNISDIHGLLSVGAEYNIGGETNEDTIWIIFKNITDKQEHDYTRHLLPIDGLEDYFGEGGHESEIFDGGGINIGGAYLGGYMPTRKRLEEVDGEDWY